MTVRVTQSMLNRTFLQNLSRNLASLDKLQNQLSSGPQIAKPSDDPVVAVRGMTYRSALVEIAQFKRNVDEGLTWLETTDKALDEATNLLQRA
ncbi:MAG TPA: flagellar hook-associated protein FlgL, partial [Calditerricola sp.]